MINIVVISHADLAQELVHAAAMIIGKTPGVYHLGLQPGDTPESFSEKLDNLLVTLQNQETLLLIDILSGTPYNLAAKRLVSPDVECVAGVNLGILLEALLTRENITVSELADYIARQGLQTIKNIKPLLKKL